jgi:hypothetical protein
MSAAVSLVGVGGGNGAGSTSSTVSTASAHIVMTTPTTGYAVWPSGVRWIVISTTDGWRSVTNRTPVAVPTDGGLVLAAGDGQVAVGVLPFQQLTVSPVLTSDGTTRQWAPTQLPSALAPAPTAIARSPGATWAVLVDGAVVTSLDHSSTWSESTSARRVDGSGSSSVTGVAFPALGTGFLTLTTTGSGSVLVTTDDGGRTWRDSGVHAVGLAATAWTPCRIGRRWVAPVQVDDQLVVFVSDAATGPWVAGPQLPHTGRALVTCTPERVLAAVPDGASDVLYSAPPGGAWSGQGSVDRHLNSLTAVSDIEAFAIDGDPSHVLDVALDGSARVVPLALPGWVATLGGPSMRA